MTCEEITGALRQLAAELAERIATVTDEQWRARPADGGWSAAAIAGHIAEVMPYWAFQVEQQSLRPEPLVGRDLDAPERLGGPINGEARSPREAAATVAHAAEQAAESLRRIPESAWEREVTRRGFGVMPLSVAVQTLTVEHVRQHLEQLQAALDAAR